MCLKKTGPICNVYVKIISDNNKHHVSSSNMSHLLYLSKCTFKHNFNRNKAKFTLPNDFYFNL